MRDSTSPARSSMRIPSASSRLPTSTRCRSATDLVNQRVREINAELMRLNQTRLRLLEERRQLASERYVQEHASEFWTERVFKVVESHPGISRSEILAELMGFTPQITTQALTNSLTSLRRRGFIKNQGTKKRPQWHVGNGSRDDSRDIHAV